MLAENEINRLLLLSYRILLYFSRCMWSISMCVYRK